MADGYTIKRIDEFEEMEGSGGATWRLARKTLGAEAFGFNVVDIEAGRPDPGARPHRRQPGGGLHHPRGRGRRSSPTTRSTRRPPAPSAATRPEVKRTIRNKSDATVRALLIGVPLDSGYQGMPWGYGPSAEARLDRHVEHDQDQQEELDPRDEEDPAEPALILRVLGPALVDHLAEPTRLRAEIGGPRDERRTARRRIRR